MRGNYIWVFLSYGFIFREVFFVGCFVKMLFEVVLVIFVFMMVNVVGKNDNFRRIWDRDEYEKKVKE